ncbi:BTB/POZ domain-containing protein [Ditylenchus destructor]|uniref:BTB/POZ domain-containing protein n=1 Tax=Ditylenchus destructor TaxID=166010 RepID=A0AAD4N7R4_9BILA|nr:BTB/POZ domain-containing protein [Ditylenchus destructor]
MRQPSFLETFNSEREKLQIHLAKRIQANMTTLIGDVGTADILLVAADGRKLAAHLCILRERAPVFFQRYVQPTFDATPRDVAAPASPQRIVEVAVGDVDSAGLAFFIRSVYTDDEVAQLPGHEAEHITEYRTDDGDDDDNDNGRSSTNPLAKDVCIRKDSTSHAERVHRYSGQQFPPNEHNTHVNEDSRLSICNMENQKPEMRSEITTSYLSSQHLNSPTKNISSSIMTSFRELASSESQLCVSGYSDASQLSETDPNDHYEQENEWGGEMRTKNDQICKFIRLDAGGSVPASPVRKKLAPTQQQPKSIFPMFIGLSGEPCASPLFETNTSTVMTQSLPVSSTDDSGAGTCTSSLTSSAGSNSLRNRAMNAGFARRLSMASLSSLSSIGSLETMGTFECTPLTGDRNPASQLAFALLNMYINQVDTDVAVLTDDGELFAHRCILQASCTSFQKLLQQNPSALILKGYSKSLIHFVLSFIYGGLTCIDDDVDVWEVLTIATEFELEDLIEVAILHLRAHKCHFFHRPCASCVSAIFDALPQFHSNECLQRVFNECLTWQARHFTRIWKGRTFLHLDEKWQKQCFDALLQYIMEENVIDTLLGCEKLQIGLPRVKAKQAAERVQYLIGDVVEYCMEFLSTSFDLVIGSDSFSNQGRGFALNLSLMEDIFPAVIHSLSTETAIKAFVNIKALIVRFHEMWKSQDSDPVIPTEEWNPKFLNLCRRLYELIDRHLLHYAASVVKCDAWNLLPTEDQTRIKEGGIFTEMKMPRAPPPKFSSSARTMNKYKRSSSAGAQMLLDDGERSRSAERARFSRVSKCTEPMEEIPERENSQTQMCIKSSVNERANKSETEHSSKIPARIQSASTKPTTEKKLDEQRPGTSEERAPEMQMTLQRQNTHTVMTVQQNREAGIDPAKMGVPVPGPNLVKSKPQSVVRPMPKTPVAIHHVSSATQAQCSQPIAVGTVGHAAKIITTDQSRRTSQRMSQANSQSSGKNEKATTKTVANQRGTRMGVSRIPRTSPKRNPTSSTKC